MRNGIGHMLLAAFFFAAMGAITKTLSVRFSSVELIFFRNFVGIGFVVATFWHRPLQQIGGRPGLLIFRGIIGTSALFAFFYGITKIRLAEATTYNLVYPIWIAVISAFYFHKPMRSGQWIAIFIGFAGVLFIFRPNLSFPLKYHLIGAYSGLGSALAYLSIKELSAFYDSRATVLSFMISGVVLPLLGMGLATVFPHPDLDFILAPFVWPIGVEWLALFVLGLLASLGQIFVTQALSIGKPEIVGPINYAQIPFAIGLGALIGDALPDAFSMLGIGLIMLSGTWITLLQRKQT